MTGTPCGNGFGVIQCRNAATPVALAGADCSFVLRSGLCRVRFVAKDRARHADCRWAAADATFSVHCMHRRVSALRSSCSRIALLQYPVCLRGSSPVHSPDSGSGGDGDRACHLQRRSQGCIGWLGSGTRAGLRLTVESLELKVRATGSGRIEGSFSPTKRPAGRAGSRPLRDDLVVGAASFSTSESVRKVPCAFRAAFRIH